MSYPAEFACHFLGVGGVVLHRDRVLLVKLTYGPAKGRWLVPGGLVDQGETLQEAVRREVLEETGVEVEPIGIIGIRSLVRKSDNLTDVYSLFLCRLKSRPDSITSKSVEVSEVKWIPLKDLDKTEISIFSRKSIMNSQQCKPMYLDNDTNRLASMRENIKKYEQFWTE